MLEVTPVEGPPANAPAVGAFEKTSLFTGWETSAIRPWLGDLQDDEQLTLEDEECKTGRMDAARKRTEEPC